MDFSFSRSGISKSFVLMHKEEEIRRARYQSHIGQSSVKKISDLDSVRCYVHDTDEWKQFMKASYGDINIISSKGPSASWISIKDNLLSCIFVETMNIAVCVFGVENHVYMLRFTIQDHICNLVSVYEMCSNMSNAFLDGELPLKFSLCNVCYKKTKKQCQHCSVMYCSKRCQRIDFPYHKEICRKNVCEECL